MGFFDMDIGTRLSIWWRAELIGEDEFGNRYYQDKKSTPNGFKRRWVIYKGLSEASKISADWHGWMHHTAPHAPIVHKKHFWEKQHQLNLTGTSEAYRPKGSIIHATHPEKSPYQPWRP